MLELIISIISSTALSVLFSGALIWVTKSWISERIKSAIKHEYDEKLETHRAQLKAQSDISIEKLRSDLKILEVERSVRYSRVFDRTADTIATTYEKFLAFRDAVDHYTSPIAWTTTPPLEERRKKVAEKIEEFSAYYRPRSLFLPKETTKRIDEIVSTLRNKVIEFMHGVEDGRDERRRQRDPEKDTAIEVYNFMSKEAPKLQEQLQDDFRTLLGTASTVSVVSGEKGSC